MQELLLPDKNIINMYYIHFFQEKGASLPLQAPILAANQLVLVWDPEVGKQNPSENKHLKLARSVTRGVIDRDLKPSSTERKYELFCFFLF